MDDINELREIRAKLEYAEALIDAGADNRVIRAELADAANMLMVRELHNMPFPLICECDLKNTPAKHTQTTQKIAEQAFHNLRRYRPAMYQNLDELKQRGGFGCIEIRLLLKGLDSLKYIEKSKRDAFVKQNPDIRL